MRLRPPVPRAQLLKAWVSAARAMSERLPNPPRKSACDVRIVSYNVHNGFFDPADTTLNIDEIMSAVVALAPDVLAMQEIAFRSDGGITPAQLQSYMNAVGRRIGDPRASLELTGVTKASDLYGWFGNALWHSRRVAPSVSDAPGAALECDLDAAAAQKPEEGRSMVIRPYDVPELFSTGRKLWLATLQLDVHDRSGRTRLAEAAAAVHCIQRTVDADDYVVITGDFNAILAADYTPEHLDWLRRLDPGQDFRVLDFFRQHGFRDAAEMAGVRLPLSVWPGKRVDFVLLGHNFQADNVHRAFVWPTAASDHFPLVVDLVFPPAPPPRPSAPPPRAPSLRFPRRAPRAPPL